jgi:hypothetical protein
MPTSSAADRNRISEPADVARALTVVRDRASQRASTAQLRQPVTTASEDVIREALPVHEHLAGLLPGGLPCGATVEVRGSHGARSLLIATISQASAAGHWTAVVGMAELNPLAIAEVGADLAHIAIVPHPQQRRADVIAALCDGMALVVTAVPAGLAEAQARALAARARRTGCILVPFGDHWPASDLILESGHRRWHERPNDRLPRCWEFDVTVRGRGAASRPRRQPVHLPAGTAKQHCPLAVPAPLRLVDSNHLRTPPPLNPQTMGGTEPQLAPPTPIGHERRRRVATDTS